MSEVQPEKKQQDGRQAASLDSTHAGSSPDRAGAQEPLEREFTDLETRALDRSTVRRLDLTVLPLAMAFYLLSFIDRSNIGNARVAGLQTDLGLTSKQYLIVITITYCPYIAAELPSNLLLTRIGPKIMLPAMVTLWGLVTTLTGLVQNYAGLLAARFMLGLLEGGLFPGLVLYLSFFYRRRELQVRIALFFSAASLSGAFSGLLAAAIQKLNGKGGLEGWRYIFILEGIFTVVFGVFSYFVLPSKPQNSLFLRQDQKDHVIRRLALDVPEGEQMHTAFSWREILKAAKSPHVLILGVALFSNGVTLYGLSYFLPSIVATFRYSTIRTQLLTVPPFAAAFVTTLATAYLSDRYQMRSASAMSMALLSLVGYCVFLRTTSRSARYGSLFPTVVGVYSTAPALVTHVPNNSAPHYRKAVAVAWGFINTNAGGILSTWLFPQSEGPLYLRATKVNIGFATLTFASVGINLLYLIWANKQKERQKAISDPESWKGQWNELGDKHPQFRYTY